MKQLVLHLRSGEVVLEDVPSRRPGPNEVCIQTQRSVISPGTERMLLDFGRAGLIERARLQPEKVQQALNKLRQDGVMPTLEAIYRKLDAPMPLGYCNAGVVIEAGEQVRGVRPGDRVISNGPHAEEVCAPQNLCARIPEGVAFEQAAFTPLAAVALQGIRLAAPTFGESVVVFGMGLVGQLTVQLLLAHGCRVLAVDLNEDRLDRARAAGAGTCSAETSDPVAAARAWSDGRGVDAVLIAASARGDEIVHQAAQACRRRGRIVLTGVVDLNLRRSDFYEKELSFQVSCSYGPGRYDAGYEQKGLDYPVEYVRWTEQRNFESVLHAMQTGGLKTEGLVTHRVDFKEAATAYADLGPESGGLGIVLEYPEAAPERRGFVEQRRSANGLRDRLRVGMIGAGNFATGTLLPLVARQGLELRHVVSRTPLRAKHAAGRYGFQYAGTDPEDIFSDDQVDAVCIAVEPGLHAGLAERALRSGKHVFIEKPLAIREAELGAVRNALNGGGDLQLCVDFNRRFSPFARRIHQLLKGRQSPLAMTMTVNTGALPADHWMSDAERSGGPIVCEVCHFIDLMQFLAEAPVHEISAASTEGGAGGAPEATSLSLRFGDGSIGTIHYFSNGTRRYPKERLEVFNEGRVLVLDNFRRMRGYGFSGFRSYRSVRQDKGHANAVKAFFDRVREGGAVPQPFEQIENVSLAAIAGASAAAQGRWLRIESASNGREE